MIQRKRKKKSAAWQQVTGATGRGADGRHNTTLRFYWDACGEFSPLSIFEADVIRVSKPLSCTPASIASRVLTYRRTGQMTITSPMRWHNLLTQRTTLWCHTFRPVLHLAANLLHHLRKKGTRQQRDNVGTGQKTSYIFKPLCRRSGALVVCLPARVWDVIASCGAQECPRRLQYTRLEEPSASMIQCEQHLSAVVHIPVGLYYWLLQWLWLMHEWCSLYSSLL